MAAIDDVESDWMLRRDAERILRILLPFLGAGLLTVVIYGAACADGSRAASVATLLGTAMAASLVGALFGLLFGIPRAYTSAAAGLPPTPGSDASLAHAATRVGYGGNSNLEQISDWLTKILIGATLVQAGRLYDWVARAAASIAHCLNGGQGCTAFVASELVAFTLWGFFFGYLLTRRALPSLLIRGDMEGSEPARLDDAVRKLAATTTSPKDNAPAAGDPALTRVAQTIAGTPLTQVAPSQSATWARAQLLLGKLNEASRGFQIAVAADPKDLRAVEDLMYTSLYEDPPDGFETAIRVGEAVENKTAAINLYLAAAYGQKYAWQKEHHAPDEKLAETREKALRAVRETLKQDPSRKRLLASFMQPGDDDDLTAFANDEEFKRLLGSS